MKLLLTLLALLTGFAGGDVARAAPATPAALGMAVTIVEAAVEARGAQAAHRPLLARPTIVIARSLHAVAVFAAPMQPGFGPRGLRAHE